MSQQANLRKLWSYFFIRITQDEILDAFFNGLIMSRASRVSEKNAIQHYCSVHDNRCKIFARPRDNCTQQCYTVQIRSHCEGRGIVRAGNIVGYTERQWHV